MDTAALAFAVKRHFDRLSEELFQIAGGSGRAPALRQFRRAPAHALPMTVNLWKPQNTYDQLHSTILPEVKNRQDEKSKAWVETFVTLGEQLGFHVEKH